MDVVVARVAGLDVHKDTVMAAVRVPGAKGGRTELVKEFSTFSGDLLRLREWLSECGVTEVTMEATGVYWRPVVRHEALFDREGMKGPLLWAVAAAWRS
jgi:hypothetical protein